MITSYNYFKIFLIIIISELLKHAAIFRTSWDEGWWNNIIPHTLHELFTTSTPHTKSEGENTQICYFFVTSTHTSTGENFLNFYNMTVTFDV